MIDFPCSVHKNTYENSKIAVDEIELKEFKADGWLTSAEWHNKTQEVVTEDAPRRGRKPKTDTE